MSFNGRNPVQPLLCYEVQTNGVEPRKDKSLDCFSLFSGPAPILLATWAENSTTTISISEYEINKVFWKNQNVYEYKYYFMIDVLQGLQNDFQEAMERVDEAYLYDILATIKGEDEQSDDGSSKPKAGDVKAVSDAISYEDILLLVR
jgi:hypothetical protein